MMGEIGIPNGGSDLQTAVGRGFDLVEGQAVDVEDSRRGLDVQLHEIDQRSTAANEAHVSALLRSLRLGGSCNCRVWISGPNEFEGMHGDASLLLLGVLANLLNGSDDVGIGAATADIAAHQFL